MVALISRRSNSRFVTLVKLRYLARRVASPYALIRPAGFAIAQLVCLLAAVATLGHSAAAEDAKLSASIASTFDFQGKVRFCYDRIPEIIYFNNAVSGRTTVEARSIDGHTRTVFELPSPGDQRSLSCSADGSTIAALDNSRDHLYIAKSSQVSVYKFDHSLLESVGEEHSLLSPDGSMISVHGDPIYVSGPDILRQMHFLRAERGENAFFESGNAYVDYLDRDPVIDLFRYPSDGWKRQRSIAKPSEFAVHEIARCGSHIVATLSDDNDFRFLIIDEEATGAVDWLTKIGVRGLLRAFNKFVNIDGGYGRCVFPLLQKRDVRKSLLGIVTFDDEGMRRFSIEGPLLALSDDEIRLSKDGCYALFMAFKQVPEIPQFTMRQQAVVLRLPAPGCKP
jgi:hypothetical protein